MLLADAAALSRVSQHSCHLSIMNHMIWAVKHCRARFVTTLLILLASFGGANMPAAWAVPGAIYNLGTFGGDNSWGLGINDAGQVVGYSDADSEPVCCAFRYTGLPGAGGVMENLGTLGGSVSIGFGINDVGQVTGSASFPGNAVDHAFRYTGRPGSGGLMEGLGTLGGTSSHGSAINNVGQVSGSSYLSGPGQRAFRYTGIPGAGGLMEDLGTLGGTESGGEDINEAGQVVGYSMLAGNLETHAFRYTGTPGSGGVMEDLGTLGGRFGLANAINDAGQVAGRAATTPDSYVEHAFRYTGTPGAGGSMVDLGTLGGTYSEALAINDAGFVVGAAQRPGDGNVWAVLWLTDAGNTAVDLDAWLDSVNLTLGAHWRLEGAEGINNSGLITGYGYYDDGPGGLTDGYRAYILDASTLIPEPSTCALLGLALVSLLLRRAGRQNG